MAGRLEGKRTIVTGAGSGIGEAAARLFAAEGAQVMCADINGDAVAAVAADIGDAAISASVDVGDPDDCERMTADTVAAFGGVDAVYANAGVAGSGRAGDLDIDEWNRVIRINLTGVWRRSMRCWTITLTVRGHVLKSMTDTAPDRFSLTNRSTD